MDISPEVTLKRCSRCREESPRSNFPKDRSRKDGLFRRCRKCVSIESAAGYRKRRDAYNARKKIYRAEKKARLAALQAQAEVTEWQTLPETN